MTKQEKIQEAYGNGSTWDRLKTNTDTDGWCRNEAFAPNTDLLDLLDLDNIERFVKSDIQGNLMFRPKSLQGIEENNGWIKIESESDLPIMKTECYFIFNSTIQKGDFSGKVFTDKYGFYGYKTVSHYQPINKPENPLY